jgi:hypothetical protein
MKLYYSSRKGMINFIYYSNKKYKKFRGLFNRKIKKRRLKNYFKFRFRFFSN